MARLSQDELRQMLPERRRAYEKRRKKVQRNRRILAACVMLLIVLVTVLILSLTVLFPVQNIVVNGDSRYEASAIINASGINKGENIFLCNLSQAQIGIRKNLSYISRVQISRKLPSTIVIEVTGTEAARYIHCSTGYAIVDDSFKVLEIVSKEQVPKSLTEIVTKNTFTVNLSENLIDVNSENGVQAEIRQEAALVKTVFASVEESGIRDLTKVDVSAPANIYAMYQNRLKLTLGTTEQLTYKLESAIQIIKQEDALDPSETGELFLNDPAHMYATSDKN